MLLSFWGGGHSSAALVTCPAEQRTIAPLHLPCTKELLRLGPIPTLGTKTLCSRFSAYCSVSNACLRGSLTRFDRCAGRSSEIVVEPTVGVSPALTHPCVPLYAWVNSTNVRLVFLRMHGLHARARVHGVDFAPIHLLATLFCCTLPCVCFGAPSMLG